MSETNLTEAQITAGLVHPGFRLGAGQFTYSIPTAGSLWPGYGAGDEPYSGYATLNAAQAAAFRAAIALWDALIEPDFIEVADDATTRGELRAAFTDDDDQTAAYTYSGTPQPAGGLVGDVWINNDAIGEAFERGTYNFEVLIHEIGHTLGLKHPFEAPVLPAAFDDTRYTVMSYTDGPGARAYYFTAGGGGGIRASFEWVTIASPMVADIAAVQGIYGAETTTAVGDTVYRFDQDATVRQAIYDAGGVDTIDLSGFTRGSVVDLRPGAYSSIGVYTLDQQIAYWTAQFPSFASYIRATLGNADLFTHTDNLGIAFSTVIENAIGGSGNDTLIGNAVANVLTGGAGDDILTGGGGADVFRFGTGAQGNDRITDFAIAEDVFDLGGSAFTAVATSGADTILTHGGGTIRIDGVTGLTLAQWNARAGVVPPPSDSFVLAMDPGSQAIVLGTGIVSGTVGRQDVTVLDRAGRITFDGSFNAGGDSIHLAGNAGAWTIQRAGSSVVLSDGDTVAVVPVGLSTADIHFADGVRTLTYDMASGTMRIGAQTVTTGAATVTAAAVAATATGAIDASLPANLALIGPAASVAGNERVFGTAAAEEVTVLAGSRITFDASFNVGGDTIVLPGAAGSYTAARWGSSVLLVSAGETITLPVGIAGATVRFADGAAGVLRFDTAAGAVKLDAQTITATPVTVGLGAAAAHDTAASPEGGDWHGFAV